MWGCKLCEADVEDDFEVCWRCGATPDGLEDPAFVTADEAGPIYDPLRDRFAEIEPALLDDAWPEPSGPIELIEFWRTDNPVQARFIVEQLRALGVDALDEYRHFHHLEGGAVVLIRSEDEPTARAWLAKYTAKLQNRSDELA